MRIACATFARKFHRKKKKEKDLTGITDNSCNVMIMYVWQNIGRIFYDFFRLLKIHIENAHQICNFCEEIPQKKRKEKGRKKERKRQRE